MEEPTGASREVGRVEVEDGEVRSTCEAE